MKKLVFILFFSSAVSLAQVTKNVGDFNKVTSFDQIDVYLVQSSENKVQIEGKQADDVELVNKNGELKIRMPLTKLLEGDNISVTVYFKNITAVEANEGSRMACSDKIKETSFDIIAKEGSEVKLNLDTEKLTARTTNGSKLTLSGKAEKQKITVKSGGIFEAQDFKTTQTIITVKAGGEANIFATDLLDVSIFAGGHITVFGEPKELKQYIMGGGTICQAIKKKN